MNVPCVTSDLVLLRIQDLSVLSRRYSCQLLEFELTFQHVDFDSVAAALIGCIYIDKLDGHTSGPVFCLLLRVSSDYAQPITGQVTEVTCPVIGRAQPELTPSKRQKTGPGLYISEAFIVPYCYNTVFS